MDGPRPDGRDDAGADGASATATGDGADGTGTAGGMTTADGAPAGDGGFGSPGGGNANNAELNTLLANTDNRWSAASIGSFTASSLELRTGTSVIAIGGFNGDDNSPTLAQFQQYVANGAVHYFIAQGQGGSRPGTDGAKSAADQITEWVKAHYTAVTVGNVPVYDLTAPTGS